MLRASNAIFDRSSRLAAASRMAILSRACSAPFSVCVPLSRLTDLVERPTQFKYLLTYSSSLSIPGNACLMIPAGVPYADIYASMCMSFSVAGIILPCRATFFGNLSVAPKGKPRRDDARRIPMGMGSHRPSDFDEQAIPTQLPSFNFSSKMHAFPQP